MASTPELVSDSMSFVAPMIALVKNVSEASPDFLLLEGFAQSIMVFMEIRRTNLNRQIEEFGAQIENFEWELGRFKEIIKLLEKYQAEYWLPCQSMPPSLMLHLLLLSSFSNTAMQKKEAMLVQNEQI